MLRKRKRVSTALSRSRVSNERSPLNSAPQWAWRGSGVTRENRSKLANCSLRFTAGSLKGSTTLDLKEAKALLDAPA